MSEWRDWSVHTWDCKLADSHLTLKYRHDMEPVHNILGKTYSAFSNTYEYKLKNVSAYFYKSILFNKNFTIIVYNFMNFLRQHNTKCLGIKKGWLPYYIANGGFPNRGILINCLRFSLTWVIRISLLDIHRY